MTAVKLYYGALWELITRLVALRLGTQVPNDEPLPHLTPLIEKRERQRERQRARHLH